MKTNVYSDPLMLLAEEAAVNGMVFNRIVFGERYCAVMLPDGRCGVCATLGVAPPAKLPHVFTTDYRTPAGRVIMQATLNAALNLYDFEYDQVDVGSAIVASGYRTMVMIGCFYPLVKPIRDAGIELKIFDPAADQTLVRPPEELAEAISSCQLLMITATSITNNTFVPLMELVSKGTEVWLTGPSAPFSRLMFSEYPVTRLFGTRFAPGNNTLLKLVEEGKGTRGFSHTGEKVMIIG